MPRKPKIPKETIEKIIIDFSNGHTRKILLDKNQITANQFDKAVNSYGLKDDYARAREQHSDSLIDRIEGLLADMQEGSIKSDVARVSIDTLKWMAAKFYPKMFGDRTQVDQVSKNINIELTEEERAKIRADFDGEL